MFGKGKIDVTIGKTGYAPGDTVSGSVVLALKKPVAAKELSISLIGEQVTTRTTASMRSGSMSTQQQQMRVYDFKQRLDGEKEYGPGQEYRFEMKIPADILGGPPEKPEAEGKLGQALKAAQTVGVITGAIPYQRTKERVKWYLSAKLDVPRGLDVTRKVDVTIG